MTTQEELLQKRIRELEKEVAHLHSQIKHQQYGLVWLDVPEAFDEESENKIPILEEVLELAIHHDDGKPTHILIEGDNYHALTCLNYTHKGKVDVIYIDPPYNTGSDGFTYKDSRFLDKYPDGAEIKSNNPLKNSTWLSFIQKRLRLARELLSDKGVIFISIDDNEHANLKLLCDKIFGVQNFISSLPRKGSGGRQDSKHYAIVHEYILVYASNVEHFEAGRSVKAKNDFKLFDETKGAYYKTQLLRKWGDNSRREDRPNLYYPIYYNILTSQFSLKREHDSDLEIYPMLDAEKEGCWRWGKATMQEGFNKKCVELQKNKKGEFIVYERIYEETSSKTKPFSSWIDDIDNSTGTGFLKELLGLKVFDYPKPVDLVERILRMASPKKDFIVLDFFAGSGTTLHATINLNEEDSGNRQCILCQINEKNICTDVTYERNKRVMNGYTDSKGNHVEGLGNSLKYYRTAFVGKNKPKEATDEDKLTLSKKAGCLLALAENTLYEQKSTDFYQIYSDEKGHSTAIYFQEDGAAYDEFLKEVESIGGKRTVYVFSWGTADEFRSDFEMMKDVTVKSIPQPILDIYKSLNQ